MSFEDAESTFVIDIQCVMYGIVRDVFIGCGRVVSLRRPS